MDAIDQALPKPSVIAGVEGLLAKRPVILQVLRFAAIGVINTALDFIVLNVVTKTLGISSGYQLGQINVIGFTLAVIQSYLWNRYWAFDAGQLVGLWKEFVRLVLVGGLGAAAVLAVLFGSSFTAPAGYYLIILVIFLAMEVVFWQAFGLGKQNGQPADSAKHPFVEFIIVSLIGLAINSLLIGLITAHAHLASNPDLNKNLAKILATLVSLVWNFIGYKIFVFNK